MTRNLYKVLVSYHAVIGNIEPFKPFECCKKSYFLLGYQGGFYFTITSLSVMLDIVCKKCRKRNYLSYSLYKTEYYRTDNTIVEPILKTKDPNIYTLVKLGIVRFISKTIRI